MHCHHNTLPRYCAQLIGMIMAILFGIAGSAKGAPPLPEEPTREQVESGVCRIPVCAEVAFEGYNFRYYAPGRTIRLGFIPKGACECGSVRRIGDDNFKVSVAARDGKIFPNVSVIHVYPAGHRRARSGNMTTWMRYFQHKNDFDEVDDFQWDGDTFPDHHVFRSRNGRGRSLNDYFFVPRLAEFNFRGRGRPIAFNTPLGYPTYGDDEKIDSAAASQVELTAGIHIFQVFKPRLVPSRDWVTSMEAVAEAIDQRLFP
jgi:hypothetical protein